MHKQAAEVNPETKRAKGDDLSAVLEEDDDDDKTLTSAEKAAELSPSKGGQSFGSGQSRRSDRSQQSFWEGPTTVFNNIEFDGGPGGRGEIE